ncbi:MAG: OmpA family protein [Rhodobacteraceae bacterium]|nr:OmpA family protein [Paracoccaceae bacterium]MDE2760808.1 OmpA family protein [Paracoccaceae bacterium]MDE2916970.1 OmpA family protein [Paracoccaceae bacterium]MYE37154.1 OmpA family protein [Paracoccaceae bacterium]MYG42630.1 OmpA family protein [Paracoccaceae bacterium]
MKVKPTLILLLFCLFPVQVLGQSTINTGQLVFDRNFTFGRYLIPVGPFKDDMVEMLETEGSTTKLVYQIKGDSSTQILLENSWDTLNELDFEILFKCETWNCGGFEFREVIDVVESPHMFVNLGDFQFVSASKNNEFGKQFVTVLVSKSNNTGFVQIVFINPREEEKVEDIDFNFTSKVLEIETQLEYDFSTKGFTILTGVEFDSGSSDINENSISQLKDLAVFLKENPDKKVILVGHTDLEGELENNINLSSERARSVRNTLISVYDSNPDQISAHGVGFLSPHETNLTPEGRNSNRRVEALILQNFQ